MAKTVGEISGYLFNFFFGKLAVERILIEKIPIVVFRSGAERIEVRLA